MTAIPIAHPVSISAIPGAAIPGATIPGATIPGATIPVAPDPARAGFRPEPRPGDFLHDAAIVRSTAQAGPPMRPRARDLIIPDARWDHLPDGDEWTLATMAALDQNAPGLVDVVPRDIDTWCPAYRTNTDAGRRAFWVGLMSVLAWQESHHEPDAVGGGNQWFGLLQIFPPTARGYDCRATTGAALTDPIDNLNCATRIMAVTVPRDNAIALYDSRWRGIAADWGPMVSDRKRGEMIDWVSGQSYCQRQLLSVPRPVSRPVSGLAIRVAALDARLSTSGLPQSFDLPDLPASLRPGLRPRSRPLH